MVVVHPDIHYTTNESVKQHRVINLHTVTWKWGGGQSYYTKLVECTVINLLAPELCFFILAHPVYKM